MQFAVARAAVIVDLLSEWRKYLPGVSFRFARPSQLTTAVPTDLLTSSAAYRTFPLRRGSIHSILEPHQSRGLVSAKCPNGNVTPGQGATAYSWLLIRKRCCFMSQPLPTVAVRTAIGAALALAVMTGSMSAHATETLLPGVSPEIQDQYTMQEIRTLQGARTPATVKSSGVVDAGARAAAFTVVCTIKADSPHFSVGANGVIYKARVNCTGTGSYPPKATIRIRGGLFFASASSSTDTSNTNFNSVKNTDELRTVSVDNTTSTF
jgi:hypothetical protein